MTASQVYFITDHAGHIKIGYSADPERRIADLSNRSPSQKLSILGRVPGGLNEERALHLHLADHQAAGEWFIDCPPVRAAMNTCLAAGRVVFLVPPLVRPAPARRDADRELADRIRPLLRSLVDQDAKHSRSVMVSYAKVGSRIGRGSTWVRRYLAGMSPVLSVSVHDAIVRAHRDLCLSLDAAAAAERTLGLGMAPAIATEEAAKCAS